MAKRPQILNFEVVYDNPTNFCIQLTEKIRLMGERHANRVTGSYVWDLFFMKFGTWKVKSCMGTIEQETRYGMVRANTFRGVTIAKAWSKTKAEIFEMINTIPAQPLANPK